jgi:PilZ domain
MTVPRVMRRLAHSELLRAGDKWVTMGRRKSQRFPIELDVRYRTTGRRSEILVGTGQTVNISSSGVLFTSRHELPIGTRLEIFIRWPMKLNERCGLNLVGRGPVVRRGEGQLAVRFQEWQFRTTNQPLANSSA